jgi:hypothetical protein
VEGANRTIGQPNKITAIFGRKVGKLSENGYSICLVFLKLFERVSVPLTAGLLSLIRADAKLASQRPVRATIAV